MSDPRPFGGGAASPARQLRTATKLDALVPVEVIAVTGVKMLAVDDEDPGKLVELEDYTGDVHRVTTTCLSCKGEIVLDSVERPEVMSRAFVLGVYRGVRGTFTCDGCLAKVEAAEAAVEADNLKRERLSRSDLPEQMRGFYFNEMLPANGRKWVVDRIREWAAIQRPRNGVCVHGPKGRGKSRLAATAAWARLQRWDARYISMPVLLAQLTAAWNDDARRKALHVLTGRGALIIDDLDKTSPSEWAANQVFAAIDTRLQAGAPLLVTTNLPPERMTEKWKGEVGEAIASRIAGLDVYELPGQDMRLEFPGFEKMTEEDAAKHGLVDPEEGGE